MNTAFVTFIYPQAKNYFERFINNLKKQTDKQFKLYVFNDGCTKEEITLFLESYVFPIEIIENTHASIATNRIEAFKILANQSHDYYIFGDIDDLFSTNRIEIVKQTLKKEAIVVNELNLCDEHGKVLEENLVSQYIKNRKYVLFDMIKEKNLIGFSHLALKKSCINKVSKLMLSEKILVVDWVIISHLLKEEKAYFERKTSTNYIFTGNNISLSKNCTFENLYFHLKVKIMTYKQLVDIDPWYEQELKQLIFIKKQIEKSEKLKKQLFSLYSEKKIHQYPWWNIIENSRRLKNELRL